MTWQSAAVASSTAVKHLHVLAQLHHGPYMSKGISSCQGVREMLFSCAPQIYLAQCRVMGFQTVMSLLAAAVDWALTALCIFWKLHQLNAHLFHTDGTQRILVLVHGVSLCSC